ncbi:MAG: TniB family NTP-binding protein [Thiobacillus sp.]|nr:TniB family NTP-binding protein [Thiobacillus sp.]
MSAEMPTPPDRMSWKGIPVQERLGWRKKMFIPHPKAAQALNAILDRIDRTAVTDASTGVFIVGETGSGKTRLGQHVCDLVASRAVHHNSNADHVPVVMVKCPEVSSRKQLAVQILSAMGAAFPRKHTYADLLRQLEALAVPVGLRTIILDDLQDLLRGRTRRGVQETVLALRDIFDHLSITLVLLGTPESVVVVNDNLQLRKRIPYRLSLPYFDLVNPQEVQNFKKLIHEVERWLPLAESSNLITAEVLMRLLRATNGIFQYLLDLLDQAIVEACREKQESIGVSHLGRAFDWVYGTTAGAGNPFTTETGKLRPLDLTGEPFHAWTKDSKQT